MFWAWVTFWASLARFRTEDIGLSQRRAGKEDLVGRDHTGLCGVLRSPTGPVLGHAEGD